MKVRIKAHTCEWMRRISLILTVIMFVWIWASFADFGQAKNGVRWIDITKGGYALWIFIIVGAIIILLQLIPAVIMFFSFVGTGTHALYDVIPDEKKEEIACGMPKEKSDV